MKNAPILHLGEYSAFLALSVVARSLPHGQARRVGCALGEWAYRLCRKRRTIALENLRAAFPDADDDQLRAWARGSFANVFSQGFDWISSSRFSAEELCKRWTVEGWEQLRAARDRGGVLWMTAHLGFWETAGLALGLYGNGLSVVARPLDNPHLDAWLARMRSRFGNKVILKRGAARGSLTEIKTGRSVALLIDQKVHPSQGLEIPFFGRPATTSPLPATLALRMDAPIQPFFGFPEEGGRYRIVLHPPLECPSEGPEAIEELTRCCLECIESEIRQAPERWMWMHDRWRHA